MKSLNFFEMLGLPSRENMGDRSFSSSVMLSHTNLFAGAEDVAFDCDGDAMDSAPSALPLPDTVAAGAAAEAVTAAPSFAAAEAVSVSLAFAGRGVANVALLVGAVAWDAPTTAADAWAAASWALVPVSAVVGPNVTTKMSRTVSSSSAGSFPMASVVTAAFDAARG